MKYLGIDFGLKRVGLATSEGTMAAPWKVITGKNFLELIDKIYTQASDFDKVVIGLPQGNMGKKVKQAIKILQSKGLDILEADETLSTKEAIRLMIELNIPKKKRVVSDDYSAAIILQKYLDSK
ncbi:pre-16S rRNA-processing nuclease YqgF [Candidatus Daviesbacteria bacterium]|nr:pre-16S rRNA-processing nuclease YqgF [Candidatus Daviesbacteria bacterium]